MGEGAKRRGRPAARMLGLADMAEAMACPVAVLRRVLSIDRRALPVTWCSDSVDDVIIAEPALWRALGVSPDLPRMCSVQEAAAYLGKAPRTIYDWINLRGPDGEALLPAWRHAGLIRLRVADVLAVPAKLPDWATEEVAA